jgi:hypothetical protein
MMSSQLFRLTARLLIVALLALHLPMRGANAAMLGTETAIDQTQATQNRERVEAFMARGDVQTQLEKMGIKADDAKSRVAAMTDDEVNQVAGKIDQLPAGGIQVWAIILIILIVLVITDFLGWTKIFPWQIGPRE